MDITQLGFVAIATIGAVNVVLMFKSDLTTQQKFILSVAFAFIFSFVPAEFGNIFADKIKEAISVALVGTGSYKLLQIAGGK